MSHDSNVDFAILDAAPALKRGEQTPGCCRSATIPRVHGHLPAGAAHEGVIDAPTAEALAAYQYFRSLPETGAFEPVVRDLMLCPRCGVPDLNGGIAFAIETLLDHLDLTFAFGKGTTDIDGYQEFDAVRRAFATGQRPAISHSTTSRWTRTGDGILATGPLPSQPSQPPQRLTFNDLVNYAGISCCAALIESEFPDADGLQLIVDELAVLFVDAAARAAEHDLCKSMHPPP